MVCLESWQIVEWAVSQPQECFYVELLLSFGSAFNVSFVARTFAQSTFALDENEKHVHIRFQRRYLLHTIIITNRAISYVGFFSSSSFYGTDSMVVFVWLAILSFFRPFFLLRLILFPWWRLQTRRPLNIKTVFCGRTYFLHNARMILTVYLLRPHNFCVRFV